MDFRPTRKTLVINYAVTFAAVGMILWLSIGRPVRYYYSPEYTSHGGYGAASTNCGECHIKPFVRVEERTCYTGECHTNFDPRLGELGGARLARLTEEIAHQSTAGGRKNGAVNTAMTGPLAPQYAAVVAFHARIGTAVSCEQCHPSHRLPQTAPFNAATIANDLNQRLASQSGSRSLAQLRGMRGDIFHANAKEFTGEVSCATCHVGPAAVAGH